MKQAPGHDFGTVGMGAAFLSLALRTTPTEIAMFHLSPARPHHQPRDSGLFGRPAGLRLAGWPAAVEAVAVETSSTPDPSGAVTQIVGAEGGTVTGPDGVQVVIPAGALDANTAIGIARSSAGSATHAGRLLRPGAGVCLHPARHPLQHAHHHPPAHGVLLTTSSSWPAQTTTGTTPPSLTATAWPSLRAGAFLAAYPSTACGTSPNDPEP